jgi:CheY-like chemotaxis protein
MFGNLLKNAIEASPEGGVVSVALESGSEGAVAHIHNAGAVPAELRSRFFEKYATAGKSGGLGLGTYSARLMARVQEGELTMRTSEAEGTTITVRLAASDQAATIHETKEVSDTTTLKLPSLRVLLVDDDEFNRMVMSRTLPSPPLKVEVAVNGRAALDAAARRWPDVVFLDLEMPVMSGYEAAAKLREMEREGARKRPIIVAISSNDDQEIIDRALASGCDRYLVKPAPREAIWRVLAGASAAKPVPSSGSPAVEPKAMDAVEVDADLEASLPAFLASRRKALDDMPGALAAGDRALFKRLAHRLAGSFALYGFRWAAAQCRGIEKDAAAGEPAELLGRAAAVRAHLEGARIRFVPAKQAAK